LADLVIFFGGILKKYFKKVVDYVGELPACTMNNLNYLNNMNKIVGL